jgi:glutaredoxin 2
MKLYYYEHCPFCIRVLMFIHWKGLTVSCLVLPNDDEETPISLIGKKMVPILESENGKFMPESLDIINYLDQLDTPILPPHYEPEAVVHWLSESRNLLRTLTYPRMIQYPFREFQTQSARDYFEAKKSAMIGPFAEHLANTDQLLELFKPHLIQLSKLVKTMPTKQIGWEDIHLFPYVLSLTLVPGIEFPPAVYDYLTEKSALYRLTPYRTIARRGTF